MTLLINSLNFSSFSVNSLGFSTYIIMSVNKNCFTFFFLHDFYFFFLLFVLSRTSSTMLTRSGESGELCLIPILVANTTIFLKKSRCLLGCGEPLCTVSKNVKWCNCYGKPYGEKLKTNYHMIQQFYFWVYNRKNWKQALEEIFAQSCSWQHYSQ